MANLTFPHGGNIYEAERRYKRNILDFSANINPLGLSDTIRRKLIETVETIRHYPDPFAKNLIKEIARYWEIEEENILLGNGSVELIYLIASALRPKKVLIPVPTFIEYELAARLFGAKVELIKLRAKEGFILNLPRQTAADAVFICNPNNPTANLLINENLRPRRGQTFIIDESFMDFLPAERRQTLIPAAKKDKRIIVLRSFTKFFALPGLRIGYLVAAKDIIEKLREYVIPWNVNTMAQSAAREALLDKTYITKTRKFIGEERRFLFNKIKEFKSLEPYPSVTNFILVKIKPAGVTSSSLKKSLINQGILIRDCANFSGLGNRYFRVAVRTRAENMKFIKALRGLSITISL